jgi:hypothetical protein
MRQQRRTENIEERVKRRAGRNKLRDAILLTAYFSVGVSMAIMTPNAMRLLKHVEKIMGPSPKLKRRISQKYSELIAQGLFERKGPLRGGKIEMTAKGRALAESLALQNELQQKPKKWDGKWRIIMFDVWERRRAVRNRLRAALEEFGFIKIQNSVWVYPYPCEKLLVFLRHSLKLGPSILYIVAEEIEHDERIRTHFKLPLN